MTFLYNTSSTSLCGYTRCRQKINKKLYDAFSGSSSIIVSAIRVYSEYQGLPFSMVLTMDEVPENTVVILSELLSEGVNSATFNSSAMPTINGIREIERGSFTVKADSTTELEVDFDIGVTDVNEAVEDVEGSFTLSL